MMLERFSMLFLFAAITSFSSGQEVGGQSIPQSRLKFSEKFKINLQSNENASAVEQIRSFYPMNEYILQCDIEQPIFTNTFRAEVVDKLGNIKSRGNIKLCNTALDARMSLVASFTGRAFPVDMFIKNLERKYDVTSDVCIAEYGSHDSVRKLESVYFVYKNIFIEMGNFAKDIDILQICKNIEGAINSNQ